MARSNNSTARTQNYDAPECGAADHSSIWVRLARARFPITSSILPRGSVVTLIGPRASRARAPRSQPPDREALPRSALELQRARRAADSSPPSCTATLRVGRPLSAATELQSATRRCRGTRGRSPPHPARSRTCGNSSRTSRGNSIRWSLSTMTASLRRADSRDFGPGPRSRPVRRRPF